MRLHNSSAFSRPACRLLSPTSQLFRIKPDRDTSRDSRPIRLIYVAMQLGCVVGTAGMFAREDVRRLFRDLLMKLDI
jgi:hypothetical protein